MSLRAFALLGSGEFEPWTVEMDHWLMNRAGGDGTVLIAPTASAPEGDAVFDRWGRRGIDHFAERGTKAAVLPLKTREDAATPSVLEPLERASLVYFSGGNPWYLAEVLRDTPAWATIVRRLDEGLAFAGCSAGVACLTESTFDSDTQSFADVFKAGLGLIPRAVFAPHWDIVDGWIPGAREFILDAVPEDHVFVGLDEDTAMLGDGSSWEVAGKSAIHVRRGDVWTVFQDGDRFELALLRED